MAKWLKTLFLVHAVLAAVVGAALLAAPGRVLGWLGWAPVDPLLTRLLGAALLALAWTSLRGALVTDWARVSIVVEAEIVYSLLGCAGLLRHLLKANYTLLVWGPFFVLAAFALVWIVAFVWHSLAYRRERPGGLAPGSTP